MNTSIENKSNKVYYNIDVYNTSSVNILARQDVSQLSTVIPKAKEYYLAITRFSVDASYIPISIIYVPNTATLETEFKFSVESGAFSHTETVIFQPDITSAPVPSTYDPKDRYFWIYNYQTVCDMFNVALTALNVSIRTDLGIPTMPPPYFIYDPDLTKFELIVPYEYITNSIDLFMNNEFGEWFNSFPVNYNLNDLDKYAKFDIQYTGDNAYTQYGQTQPATLAYPSKANPLYIIIKEEYTNLAPINSLTRIVFTTNTLPVAPEFSQTNNTPKSSTVRQLTDFTPLIEKAGAQRSVLTFYQNGPYRLIDCVGDSEIRNVDLQVWWVDKTNTLHEMYLQPGSYMDIKLAFIKKDSFTS